MGIDTKKNDLALLLFSDSSDFGGRIKSEWFEPEYWRRENRICGESKGRLTTWFIDPPSKLSEQYWVLRHYYRGGLIANFVLDQYLYTGLKNTRPYLETSLLLTMTALGLAAPKVIGARIRKQGLFYTADLLMEKIIGTDLASLLKKQFLSAECWILIGKTIAEFHAKGICHSDLNSHNILIQDDEQESQGEKIWLIDFDQCKQRSVGAKVKKRNSWQEKNLARLYRSLVKEKNLFPGIRFDNDVWSSLLRGYNSVNIAPKDKLLG